VAILADHPLGLFWAYRFHDGAAVALFDGPIPANLQGGEGWIWAHFPLSDQRSRAFLANIEDAPDEVREILLGTEESPRIQFSGGWAFGILPDFEREFDGRVTGPGRLRFAFDDKRFITVRRHALQVADDMHHRLTSGSTEFADPLEAFIALNKRYCELAEDQLDELADRMDSVEDKVLADTQDLERLELGPLRRDLSRRHREISLLRTAYRRSVSRQPHAHAYALAAHLPQLEQQGEDLDRAIMALQDRARLIHEDIDTKITSATNRTLRTLTIISVVLMPPTLIVGAFGMNLDGILFAKSPHGFWLAGGLCVLTIIAAFVLLRGLRILK
jgi:zinc transporter